MITAQGLFETSACVVFYSFILLFFYFFIL